MYQIKITEKDAGQRLDKYLHRILPRAESGFLYKMLRKKNITLNDKKAGGGEKIVEGDSVTIYFSDETLEKFMGRKIRASLDHKAGETLKQSAQRSRNTVHRAHESAGRHNDDETIGIANYISAYDTIQNVRILYENDHILLVDKPAGVLSQKAEKTDISLNEWLIGYLMKSGAITEEELAVYKPSVCNRLDRNTSGIVLCSKTLKGAQLLSGLLKNRTLHKYYRLYVKGIVSEEQLIEGYLIKDEKLNKVYIESLDEMKSIEQIRNSYIKTGYKPVKTEHDKTLLEVELITGKTHQIRAHLASVGHPLLGDYKYGDKAWNDEYRKKYRVRAQLLHAYKVVFPELEEPFEDISGGTFTAELPEIFMNVSDKDA